MGKSKANTPNLATLMAEFMEQQTAKDAAFAAELREIRTGMIGLAVTGKEANPEAGMGGESRTTSTPKAKTGKRKARKAAKRDLDVASVASQKFAPSSDKATRKVKAWADAGNVGRLREYAGTGPRVSGTGDPRVAVTEGNRILAQNVLASYFTKSGKPNKADNAATSK